MSHHTSDPLDDLLERTSRTFAVGIRRLPGPLRREITVAYLLLRVSDYFEDNRAMADDEKIQALEAWADALAGGVDSTGAAFDARTWVGEAVEGAPPDREAALAARDIMAGLDALDERTAAPIRAHVIDSTRGMARWVRRGPDFRTIEDLDDYMFEVAGRVGLLLTDVFAARFAPVAARAGELRRSGTEFGLALQTVNVIRGLNDDPDRGWIFVPTALLPAGRAPAELWADDVPDRDSLRRAVLNRLVTKAEAHLHEGLSYTLTIPRRLLGVRIFCLLPLLFAARTLALSRDNPRVFDEEVKLTRAEVGAMVAKVRLGALSDGWCRRTFRRMLS
jgi:farnesyl-diphosphate farnesyltransferase